MSGETRTVFPGLRSDAVTAWEHYAQDDSTVTVERAEHSYRLSCSCGAWSDRASSESEANNKAMSHVLAHDIACEEAGADDA